MANSSIRHGPSERRPIPGPLGRSFVERASASDTKGAYSVLEFTAPPHGPWGTLHVHDADEAWYIIEGELSLRIGDDAFTATAGSFVLAPGGVPHANASTGDVPARFLIIFSPPGLERYLADFAAAVEAAHPDEPGREALDALARQHGITPAE